MSNKNKSLCLIASLLLILTVTIGGVIAFITTHTDTIENIFNAPTFGTEVDETFDGEVKTDVKIINTGDTDSYIRAKIIVNWVKGEGADKVVLSTVPVLGEKDDPESGDYYMNLDLEHGWVKHNDGYYYYTEPVAGESSTKVLITEAAPLKDNGDYKLEITILAESIQASPKDAIHDSWHVDIDDGKVTDYSKS